MGYEKRIAVLKQIGAGYSGGQKPIAGIFKIESYAGQAQAEVSLMGAKEDVYHAAVLCGDGQSFRFCVQNRLKTRADLPSAPALAEGVACLIVAGSEYAPVAFGCSGLVACSIADMREVFLQSIDKGQTAEAEREAAPSSEPSVREDSSAEDILYRMYQDEVVASENYYLMPDVDMATLSVMDGAKRENECECGDNQDDAASQADSAKEQDGAVPPPVCRNEADGGDIQKRVPCAGTRYYQTVKKELEQLFASHPAEHILQQNVPDSRWIRVDCEGGRHYVVGVIEQGGEPAYICYGVPGRYQANPPKELTGYCSYLPLSLFDLHGEGYWMMFQDADTGECCHVSLC